MGGEGSHSHLANIAEARRSLVGLYRTGVHVNFASCEQLMSGEDLRRMARTGEAYELRKVLERRANTCSTEGEYGTIDLNRIYNDFHCFSVIPLGLTPLHYACWNGHVECVKLLVSNNRGVDNFGNKRSSLDMQSCLGFTGQIEKLHESCLETTVVIKINLFPSLASCCSRCTTRSCQRNCEAIGDNGFGHVARFQRW